MTEFSAVKIWSLSETDFLKVLDSCSLVGKDRRVKFYAPSFAYNKASHDCSSHAGFPTISVTGSECALKCKHCGGRVLKTMVPAETPTKLFELAEKLKREGAAGFLLSGGCSSNGSVPLERFIPALAKIKRELGLTVAVHTGIINASTAEALKEAGIDTALIDVIGSDQTIRKVCSLNVAIGDYEDSLKAMHAAGLRVVPHVIVGLQNGKLEGEFRALKMIKRYDPAGLVIIAFIPIRGTEMENVKPPAPEAIARVVAAARLMFPETPLALGCMRPKGKHRALTDVLALKAGVDAIAFPTEVVDFAKNNGYEMSFSPYCCSQIYVDYGNSGRSVSK